MDFWRNVGEYVTGKEGLIPGRDTKGKLQQQMSGGDANWLPISVQGGDRSPMMSIGGIGYDPSFSTQPASYDKPTTTPDAPTKETTIDETRIQPDPIAALRAQRSNQARQVKDRLLGRSGEIDAILNDILGRVDSLVADRKNKRQGQYDSESASLIDALNAAIPEIQKAFASLGLSSSTFVGDRVDNTNKEYEKSQGTVDETFNNDLATYGTWAESEKGNARANADKARNTMSFVRDSEADADNLGRFQESELSFNNALTDFGNARNQYTTSGDALQRLEGVGSDYDFSKIMDSFGSLAASSANTGTGGGAAKAVLDNIRGLDPKNKKKLTEAQVNNPVGAATA